MDAQEQRELLFRKTLDSYVFALDSVLRHASRAVHGSVNSRLQEFKRSLQSTPSIPILEASRQELEADLTSLTDVASWQEAEIRKILKTLAEATGVFTRRNDQQGEQLQGLALELENLSRTEDIVLLRVGLASHVRQFRDCIARMHQENREGFNQLNAEMHEFRERLQQVEVQASRDPLTGLYNRRTCETLLVQRIDRRTPFSIVLFDMNRFKAINDRHGHLAGDNTLCEFSNRLRQALRAQDVAVRWGGDEFLVIIDCALPDAITISRRLAQTVCGRYNLMVNGSSVTVDVSAAIGVAQYKPGETIEQLFSRADAGLYGAKGTR